MMILVTGGSKNGKSHWAESYLDDWTQEKYYIACMEPYGQEAMAAVMRHQKMRAGKGFCTIEKHRKIEEIEPKKSWGILLECISTLCANEMFQEDGSYCHPADRIIEAVRMLKEKAGRLVVVTNEVGEDGGCYEEGTRAYIREIGQINQALADMADQVVECVCGIPIIWKGR